MLHNKLIFLLSFITLLSCQQKHSKVQKAVIQGIWEKRGYGQVIQITKTEISFYDVTKKSCLPVRSTNFKNIKELGEIIKLTSDSLVLLSGINRYQYTRIKTLPEFCKVQKETIVKDPAYNFEIFWNTFNENYAFFEKRNIHWDQVYKDYRSRINKKTTDKDLYKLLTEIINKFNDGHITLDAPEVVVKEAAMPKKIEDAAEDGSLSKIPDVSPIELRKALLKRYIKQPNFWGRDLYGKGLLNWGITKENVGYIQVNWMLFYRDYSIADSIKGGDYADQYFKRAGNNPIHMIEEVKQARKIMDSVIMELKNVEGIILDIRLNGGGYDAVSLEILNHFVTKKTIAFSKKTWLGKTFSESTPIYLRPSKNRFTGPVMLLTSHSTASAAEIMAMGSMGLKNFKRIGSLTEGIFSDMLEKKLPNGWSYSLSNQVYINSSNENFENYGIPPNIKLAYSPDANKFRYSILKNINFGDSAIDTAISLINKAKKATSDRGAFLINHKKRSVL